MAERGSRSRREWGRPRNHGLPTISTALASTTPTTVMTVLAATSITPIILYWSLC